MYTVRRRAPRTRKYWDDRRMLSYVPFYPTLQPDNWASSSANANDTKRTILERITPNALSCRDNVSVQAPDEKSEDSQIRQRLALWRVSAAPKKSTNWHSIFSNGRNDVRDQISIVLLSLVSGEHGRSVYFLFCLLLLDFFLDLICLCTPLCFPVYFLSEYSMPSLAGSYSILQRGLLSLCFCSRFPTMQSGSIWLFSPVISHSRHFISLSLTRFFYLI